MGRIRIIAVKRDFLILSAMALLLLLAALSYCIRVLYPVHQFVDPMNGIIIIDPGHGGIDGGTNRGGLLEKDINLSIALKMRTILEDRGYTILMTRDDDRSLESPDRSGISRHESDLSNRVKMINTGNAQLFVSIHVNCNVNKPSTNGSIVFYGEQYPENKILAMSIQKKLNLITLDSGERMIHDPKPARFFLLNNSKIPGVIVETAFISNSEESRLLAEDNFRERLASAVCKGVIEYLSGRNQAIIK